MIIPVEVQKLQKLHEQLQSPAERDNIKIAQLINLIPVIVKRIFIQEERILYLEKKIAENLI